MLNEDRKAAQDQRRATFVVAGVVALLALVIAGGIVFFVRGDDGPGSSSARQPVIPPESSAGDPMADGPEQLTSANVKWSNFFGVPLPTSSAGPSKVEGERASGFAHNPAGAVLAAIHISYRVGSAAGPGVFGPTINEQMVGTDKAKFATNVENNYETSRARYGLARGEPIAPDWQRAVLDQSGVWAYRIDGYDPSLASVNVLTRTVPRTGGGGPIYVNFSYTVRWVDGDWRLVAPLNGEWPRAASQLSTIPSGYVVLGRQ